MSTPTSSPEPDANAGYEHTDVQPRRVLVWIAVLFIVSAGVFVMSKLMLSSMSASVQSESAPEHPLAGARPQPPGPRLQVVPTRDIEAHRTLEREQLTTYGWIDPVEGVVRIPIARALELALEGRVPSAVEAAEGAQ